MRLLGIPILLLLVITGSDMVAAGQQDQTANSLLQILMRDHEQAPNRPLTLDYEGTFGKQVAQGGAEEASGKSDVFESSDTAARKSTNPLGGDFMVLFNVFDVGWLDGDITSETRNTYTWGIQPVIPIALGDNWIWVTRPTVPIIIDAEVPTTPAGGGLFNFDNTGFGLGDMILISLVGQSLPTENWGGGDLVWAGGGTFQFPTATLNAIATNKYAGGPAGTIAFIGREWIAGVLGQHWWDFADADGGMNGEINRTNLQLLYFLNFPGGWQIGGSPEIEVDWTAPSGERWSVPIGLGVQKVEFLFGKVPVKFGAEVQYYVVSPDGFGKDWRIKFTVAPILPNLIGNLFK